MHHPSRRGLMPPWSYRKPYRIPHVLLHIFQWKHWVWSETSAHGVRPTPFIVLVNLVAALLTSTVRYARVSPFFPATADLSQTMLNVRIPYTTA